MCVCLLSVCWICRTCLVRYTKYCESTKNFDRVTWKYVVFSLKTRTKNVYYDTMKYYSVVCVCVIVVVVVVVPLLFHFDVCDLFILMCMLVMCAIHSKSLFYFAILNKYMFVFWCVCGGRCVCISYIYIIDRCIFFYVFVLMELIINMFMKYMFDLMWVRFMSSL